MRRRRDLLSDRQEIVAEPARVRLANSAGEHLKERLGLWRDHNLGPRRCRHVVAHDLIAAAANAASTLAQVSVLLGGFIFGALT
jgi:hypothetical protein